jgi:hypothetical protein
MNLWWVLLLNCTELLISIKNVTLISTHIIIIIIIISSSSSIISIITQLLKS